MVTTNQTPIIDTYTKKRIKFKRNTKDSHQITREESKRREELQRTTKATSKELKWKKYIPISN